MGGSLARDSSRYNDAMPILNERDQAAVRKEFERIAGPVKLVVFSQSLTAPELCQQNEQLVREVAELSDQITVERTRSEATDMCCARRTARGQCGQVGVEKTLMSTSVSRALSEAKVSSESPGWPVEATMIESIRLLNS